MKAGGNLKRNSWQWENYENSEKQAPSINSAQIPGWQLNYACPGERQTGQQEAWSDQDEVYSLKIVGQGMRSVSVLLSFALFFNSAPLPAVWGAEIWNHWAWNLRRQNLGLANWKFGGGDPREQNYWKCWAPLLPKFLTNNQVMQASGRLPGSPGKEATGIEQKYQTLLPCKPGKLSASDNKNPIILRRTQHNTELLQCIICNACFQPKITPCAKRQIRRIHTQEESQALGNDNTWERMLYLSDRSFQIWYQWTITLGTKNTISEYVIGR